MGGYEKGTSRHRVGPKPLDSDVMPCVFIISRIPDKTFWTEASFEACSLVLNNSNLKNESL